MKASNLFVIALILLAGYIAGARWPQWYGAVMSRVSGG